MDYQKITKEVEVNTRGGATATGGSLSIGDLERHGTIYADKLVPFHAVETAVVNVSTESASRPDPYGCDGDGEPSCTTIIDESNAQFNEDHIPGYVSYKDTLEALSVFPETITITIDGTITVLPEQPEPEGGYPIEGLHYYALEPLGTVPGNPSVGIAPSDMSMTVFASQGTVEQGTHSLKMEFCTKA